MEEAEPALVAELEGVGSFADRRRVRPRVVRLLTPVTRALNDRRGHARAVAEAVRSTRP